MMIERHNEAAPYGIETGQLRERIAVLEANYRHTIERIETMADQMEEVHALLLQAKGARWTLLCIAGVLGFTVASIKPLAQWISGLLR